MSTKLRKVLIMAGGTGGHVFPGLSVAKSLQKNGVQVAWLGTKVGFEAKVVPEHNIPLHFIAIKGLKGKGLKDFLYLPGRLILAIIQSIIIIKKFNPDIVIGMGGFVSGPGGIASWLLRYPLIIHEQNAKPGTTNQWLAKVAQKVLEGFPNTFLQHKKIITIGNPVRDEIAQLPKPDERFKNKTTPLRLLVLGGSAGARAINQLIPVALAKIPANHLPEVYHQTGEKLFDETIETYKKNQVNAKVVPFIKDMADAYAWADIVLCRSGALTVAELCAVGLGSILVPYPYAIDDHQTANANYLVKQGAAWLIQQNALTEDGLANMLIELSISAEKRLAMANAAYQLRKVDAAEKVLNICEEVL